MTSIGGNDMVFFGDSVLNACCYSFLAGGKMAEASNFLLFVESVCGHLHPSRRSVDQYLLSVEFTIESYRIETIS